MSAETLPPHFLQEQRFHSPHLGIREDLDAIYNRNEVVVGWPDGVTRIFEDLARRYTVCVVGAALGDEGKGRIIDNKVDWLLNIPGVERAYVVRFQGGNNSGHTLEVGDHRFALHQVPSGVMYEEAVGIMDSGMVINPGDLMTEVGYVEDIVGDTRGKLILSKNAMLNTDLERAEEGLNQHRSEGSKGGTKRGIGPTNAHRLDRLGVEIHNLLAADWREMFGKRYDDYEKYFAAFEFNLAEVEVPDFAAEKQHDPNPKRKVGTKEEFLDRLEIVRTWIIDRDMVQNTFLIHDKIYNNVKIGVLFEGAQALGLHGWLGTRPDVTASDTSVYGIQSGTQYWRAQDVVDRIGVFKIPYTSSVGARHMVTQVDLPKAVKGPTDLPLSATAEQRWAAFVREEAHEFGTTTGRPRDILHLDLPFLTYNARMSGIEVLAGTHLDIAQEGQMIKVCTHYTDVKGNFVPYQPGLEYQAEYIPQYVELPGWDGEACRKAKTFDELPENAQKFLAFIQRRTGFPIVAATTGPARKNLVQFPGYDYSGTSQH